jgi:hypothetical protein
MGRYVIFSGQTDIKADFANADLLIMDDMNWDRVNMTELKQWMTGQNVHRSSNTAHSISVTVGIPCIVCMNETYMIDGSFCESLDEAYGSQQYRYPTSKKRPIWREDTAYSNTTKFQRVESFMTKELSEVQLDIRETQLEDLNLDVAQFNARMKQLEGFNPVKTVAVLPLRAKEVVPISEEKYIESHPSQFPVVGEVRTSVLHQIFDEPRNDGEVVDGGSDSEEPAGKGGYYD